MDISTNIDNTTFEEIINILTQLKQFTHHTSVEQKSLTKIIFQHVQQLSLSLESLNMFDFNEWASVKDFLILIKSYQRTFTRSNTDNLNHELKYNISTIDLPNTSSKLVSLAYIKNLRAKYGCATMIEDHIRLTYNPSNNTEYDFTLFFKFISDIPRLLKIIISHVIYGGEHFLESFYKNTPQTIAHFEKIFQEILSCIDLVDGQLIVHVKKQANIFADLQKQLYIYLQLLHFPLKFLDDYELENCIQNIAPLFDDNPVLKVEQPRQRLNSSLDESNLRRQQQREINIEKMIQQSEQLSKRASELAIRPYKILQYIRTFIMKLRSIDIEKEQDETIKHLQTEGEILSESLNKYSKELEMNDVLDVKTPKVQSITDLNDEDLKLNDEKLAVVQNKSHFDAFIQNINSSRHCQKIEELRKLIKLTNDQVINRTWIQVIDLMNGICNGSTNLINQFKAILPVLSDTLAMQCDRIMVDDGINATIHGSLTDIITGAYAQFRFDLLQGALDADMLSNYTYVANLSTKIREWKKTTKTHYLNIYQSIKAINSDLTFAKNQLKNFTNDSVCSVLPIVIRPEDLLCFLVPEQTNVIRCICAKYNELETSFATSYMYSHNTNNEPLRLDSDDNRSNRLPNFGLSSFAYRDNTNQAIFLLDESLCIHYIRSETMSIIHKLLGLCIAARNRSILVNVCTSNQDLFPIHIALSLSLMILIDGSTSYLKNFQHEHLIKIPNTKTLETKLQKLQQDLNNHQKKHEKLKPKLVKVEQDYNNAETDLSLINLNEISLIQDNQRHVRCLADSKHKLETKIQQIQVQVDDIKQQIQDCEIEIEKQQKTKQNEWFFTAKANFERTNVLVKKCVLEVAKLFSINPLLSKKIDDYSLSDLLNVVLSVASEQMLNFTEVTIIPMDSSIKTIKDIQMSLLDTLNQSIRHASSLTEKDSFKMFINYYSDLMQISLTSLINSISSWLTYARVLQNGQMITYGTEKKKHIFYELYIWAREECQTFLSDVRGGHDLVSIEQYATSISTRIHKDISYFDVLFMGHLNKSWRQAIDDFQRFISRLLLVGCRYAHLQRGSRESVDDIIKTIDKDEIDSDLPNTEVELLKALDNYELQLKSHTESLLYQTLHIAFSFSTNLFGLIDKLDHSIKMLKQLVLPSAYMMEQIWNTIEMFLGKVHHKKITRDEYEILSLVCSEFQQLTEPNHELQDDEKEFLATRMKSGIINQMSEHLENFCQRLVENRPKMNAFSKELLEQWQITLKEILLGCIRGKKLKISYLIEQNKRRQKPYSSLLDMNSTNNSSIFLADIERVQENRNLILTTSEQRTKILPVFRRLEILCQLWSGGLANVEHLINNMSLEQMNHKFQSKLFNISSTFYENGERLLFKMIKDYLNNPNEINDSFDHLEILRKIEKQRFQDLLETSNDQVKHFLNDIHTINRGQILNEAKSAKEDWLTGTEQFIEQVQEKRKDEIKQFLSKGISKIKYWLPFSLNKSNSGLNEMFNNSFLDACKEVGQLMQQEQIGDQNVFILASQEHYKNLHKLHEKYSKHLCLNTFDNNLFINHDQYIMFSFISQDYKKVNIHLKFTSTNNECTTIKLHLTSKDSYYNFVVNSCIEFFSIETDCASTKKIRFCDMLNQQKRELKGDVSVIVWCTQINQSCSSVSGNSSTTPSPNIKEKDVRQRFDRLKTPIEEFNKSTDISLDPKTRIETQILSDIVRIVEDSCKTMNCEQLAADNLYSTNVVYQLFRQLPSASALHETREMNPLREKFILLNKNGIRTVRDNSIDCVTDIKNTWTVLMSVAFERGKKSVGDLHRVLDEFINKLCKVKAQLILSFSWINTLSSINDNHIKQENRRNFDEMIKECQKLYRILQDGKQENIATINMCESMLREADRLYHKTRHVTDDWARIRQLRDTKWTIETDLTKAFLYSKLGRDAHIWLLFQKTEHSPTSTLCCEPRPAILDYGVVLSGIHQYRNQRIIFHNVTEEDLHIRINNRKDDETKKSLFFPTNNETIIQAGDIWEADVIFKSLGQIGTFADCWNIVVDQETIMDAIHLKAQIEKIDVILSKDSIDFGLVACDSQEIQQNIDLKNELPCSLRVKSQLQNPEEAVRRAILSITKTELSLNPKSTTPFGISLRPANIGEDIDADICLAIDSAKNLKWLKVLARIRPIQLKIAYKKGLIFDNGSSGHIYINDLYKSEKRSISLELINGGEVGYRLKLSSSNLILTNTEIFLTSNETKQVEVILEMPDKAGQSNFVLGIGFPDTNKHCALTFICQAQDPHIVYPREISIKWSLIHLSDQEKMWNNVHQHLVPIVREVDFKNTGHAAAVINLLQINSSTNSIQLPSMKFKMEPENFKILPNSIASARFIYYPNQLCNINGVIELQSNEGTKPVQIPYRVHIDRPKLLTSPKAVIDLGIIGSEKSSKSIFSIANIGQTELQFKMNDIDCQQPCLNTVLLDRSSKPISINHIIKINPGSTHVYTIQVDCGQFQTNDYPSIVELAHFALHSICDPVMDIDGKMSSRITHIFVIGHTSSVQLSYPIDTNNLNPWNNLNLIPSKWLNETCQNVSQHGPYLNLISLTSLAYICRAIDLKVEQLPMTQNEWSQLCSIFNGSSIFSNTNNRLSLEQFTSESQVDNHSKDLLQAFFRSTITTYSVLFDQASLFQDASFNNSSIRLQLLTTINSAKNIDEVFTMHRYVMHICEAVDTCSFGDEYREALELILKLIRNDCLVSESIRPFIDYVHLLVKNRSTTINDIEKLLYTQLRTIKSSSSLNFSELLGAKSSSAKWILLCAYVPKRIKPILTGLIEDDYQALFNILLQTKIMDGHVKLQCGLLDCFRDAFRYWNELSSEEKSTLVSPFINLVHTQLSNIFIHVKPTRKARLTDMFLITKIILQRFNIPNHRFQEMQELFREHDSDELETKIRELNWINPSVVRSLPSLIIDFCKSLPNYHMCVIKKTSYNVWYNVYQHSSVITSVNYYNLEITDENVHQYCYILRHFFSLSNTQWKYTENCIKRTWELFCHANFNDVRIKTIASSIFDLLCSYHLEKRWCHVKQDYVRLVEESNWETMKNFANTISNIDESMNPNLVSNVNSSLIKEVLESVELFREENLETKAFEQTTKICKLLLYKNELSQFEQMIANIQDLPDFSSTNELFENIQSFVDENIQEKIRSYNNLLESYDACSIDSTLDEQEQFRILDSIVPSWLSLFEISSDTIQRLVNILSSIMTSFYCLISTKRNQFKDQLCTNALTAALCSLSHWRTVINQTNPIVSNSTTSIPIQESFALTLQENIIKRTQKNAQSTTVQQLPNPTSPIPTVKPSLTTSESVSTKSHYSEKNLEALTTKVKEYATSPDRINATINESDSTRQLVDTCLTLHDEIDRWYDMFTTTNNLVYNEPNFRRVHSGLTHAIVQQGLHLLKKLIVIKQLLEPIFTQTGIRFILRDRMRLENCFLSLELEGFEKVRQALQSLQVNVNRIPRDFMPPSKKLLPANSRSQRKDVLELTIESLQQTTTLPDLREITNGNKNIDKSNDVSLTMQEWAEKIADNNPKKMYDLLKNQQKKKTTSNKRERNPISSVLNIAQQMASQMIVSDLKTSQTSDIRVGRSPDIDLNHTTFSSGSTIIASLNINIAQKVLEEHMQKANLIDLYKNAGIVQTDVSSTVKIDKHVKLDENIKCERWKYQMLVESKAISRMINKILDAFRLTFESLNKESVEQYDIRWCILIDNSGSMSIHRNTIYETVVILMELLRKLEMKFTVARFGGKYNQKILKNIDELFTPKNGQYVLEALTFDEGTYPATGLARIAQTIFDKETSTTNSNIRKIVIMLTDGLTQELDNVTYSETISKYKINLGFMFIENANQSNSKLLMEALQQIKVQNCIIKSDNISSLPIEFAKLMNMMLNEAFSGQNNVMNSAETNFKMPSQINVKRPSDHKLDRTIKIGTIQEYYTVNLTDYTISDPTTQIPQIKKMKPKLNEYLNLTNQRTTIVQTIEHLRQDYALSKLTDEINELDKLWNSEENRFSKLVDDLTNSLGGIVLPFNRYTRRRAALRGSSLYLPGLIKAMTSEWSYKKIFSDKLAGGKRDHAVCLVFDVSQSMFGILGNCLRESTIVFIGALKKIGIENSFDRDDDTKDAHAIEAAIDLLMNCSTRGEKKIFLFTDGYGNCDGHLSLVQQRADDVGIDLVAMGIGVDRMNLKSSYKRYIQCATPYGLPRALRSLFENDAQIASLDYTSSTKDQIRSNTLADDTSDVNLLFSDIKTNKFFYDMIKDLAGEREQVLIQSGNPPTDMIVDICFCLDCTGSMSRWLLETKIQMRVIISGINKKIKDEYPCVEVELRFAIVGFRDIGDNQRFVIKDFTKNEQEIIEFLDSLTATGGGDCPEDVMGALDQCLQLKNWSESNARFIVLITDAPGHGTELNDDPSDNHKNGTEHTIDSICSRLLQKGSEIDLMFCCIKPEYTKKMELAFQNRYDQAEASSGKTFTVIKLFDETKQETQSFHFVFVLDDSSSMAGTPWQGLETAYQNFLSTRQNDQGVDDIFTVIQFSSNAIAACQRQHLSNTPRTLNPRFGGTVYMSGLQCADQIMSEDSSKSTMIMIFMSDGGDGGPNPLPKIIELASKYRNHNFKCHLVAFGSGVCAGSQEAQLLETMASNGGGKLHYALSNDELTITFTSIATDCNISGTLVERFADILTQNISTKIMLDCL